MKKLKLLLSIVVLLTTYNIQSDVLPSFFSNKNNESKNIDSLRSKKESSTTINNTRVNASSVSVSNTQPIIVRGLSNVDNDILSLQKLKRKIELQKLESEYQKNLSGKNENSNATTGLQPRQFNNRSLNIQEAAVFDIMINKTTNQRYATLLFPDGSTLSLEEGSIIDGYKLTNITMMGASLIKYDSKDKITKKILLKRVYARIDNSSHL